MLRRRLREATEASSSANAAAEAAAALASSSSASAAEADKTARKLRTRVADLERELAAASRPAAERSVDDVRLRVLLDALVEAAHGLRRELALPPSVARPGELVTAGLAPSGAAGGREDVAWLAALLAGPRAHLVVDGYNVTKTAWPSLSLEEQRNRLLASLRALMSRTGAEVTVVFDGMHVASPMAPVVARGLRVRFSEEGRTADSVIASYLRAEPEGRVVVVASSDREVQESARRAGARVAPSELLIGLLGR